MLRVGLQSDTGSAPPNDMNEHVVDTRFGSGKWLS
jgi:hypothetical protein